VDHAPTQLAHLRPGVRLLEVATGVVWEIERVHRANTYAIPWVHVASPDRDPRTIEAGALLTARDGGDDWRFAP
jgi:hypothetical protein